MSALFVTGTDTGCGKTRVACALAWGLRDAGLRVRVLKPVETGCEAGVPADARALAAAAGDVRSDTALCPYRLALAAAPAVAAAEAGIEIDPQRIAGALEDARAGADLVIVEGAGGLRVPLRPGLDMAGLAVALGLPLLVVARAALGTINHTQLTLEAAAADGLEVLGVVISHTRAQLPDGDARNLEGLRSALPVPLLGELAHSASRLTPRAVPGPILSLAGSS